MPISGGYRWKREETEDSYSRVTIRLGAVGCSWASIFNFCCEEAVQLCSCHVTRSGWRLAREQSW